MPNAPVDEGLAIRVQKVVDDGVETDGMIQMEEEVAWRLAVGQLYGA